VCVVVGCGGVWAVRTCFGGGVGWGGVSVVSIRVVFCFPPSLSPVDFPQIESLYQTSHYYLGERLRARLLKATGVRVPVEETEKEGSGYGCKKCGGRIGMYGAPTPKKGVQGKVQKNDQVYIWTDRPTPGGERGATASSTPVPHTATRTRGLCLDRLTGIALGKGGNRTWFTEWFPG